MVVFDNSFFCLLLHPDAKGPKGIERLRDRIEHLFEELKQTKETAIIPAPVLSEFLVFAGREAPEYLLKIREIGSAIRIEGFDERAAIELADIEIAARRKGDKRGKAKDAPWQKVKFDRQIVAIAKVHQASAIYSDDPHIVAHASECSIRVIRFLDLPKPPATQPGLFDATKTAGADD